VRQLTFPAFSDITTGAHHREPGVPWYRRFILSKQPARMLMLVAVFGLIGHGSAAATDISQASVSAGARSPIPPAGPPPTSRGTISCPAITKAAIQNFLTCQYAGPGGAHMTFYLYVPRGYDPSQSYPLVLLLHGGGERATPGQSAAQNRSVLLSQEYVAVWGPGWPTASASVQVNHPSFIVVPQVTGSNRFVNVEASNASYALAAQPAQSLSMAITIVQLLEEQSSSIDSNRLYVTGLSMGGFGVWDAIERWPSLFAAAVPVAGGGDPALAGRVAQMPTWDFHGAADTNVPVQASRLMIQALQNAGGQPCYTEYPGQPHSIWELVYGLAKTPANPLYPWLFAQNLRGSAAGSPTCG
jgi:predicted peptidase